MPSLTDKLCAASERHKTSNNHSSKERPIVNENNQDAEIIYEQSASEADSETGTSGVEPVQHEDLSTEQIFSMSAQDELDVDAYNSNPRKGRKRKAKKEKKGQIEKSGKGGSAFKIIFKIIISLVLLAAIGITAYSGWAYLQSKEKLISQEETTSNKQHDLEMMLNKLEVRFQDNQKKTSSDLADLKARSDRSDEKMRALQNNYRKISSDISNIQTRIAKIESEKQINQNAVYGNTAEIGKLKKDLKTIEHNISKLNLRKAPIQKTVKTQSKPKSKKARGPITITNIDGFKLYSVDTISGENKIVLIKDKSIRIIRKGDVFNGFSVKGSSRDSQVVSLHKNATTYKLIAG